MTATVRPQSRARPNGRNTLRVLTYHRVANPEDTPTLNPRLISATPAVFAQQMEYLARRYHVVSLPQVHAAVVSGATPPQRAVLITLYGPALEPCCAEPIDTATAIAPAVARITANRCIFASLTERV